jgi:hypothetical protein
MFADGAQVLLVQTTAELNTPDSYKGSSFVHHCYDSFYHDTTATTTLYYEVLFYHNCAQCPTGRYKNATLAPDAISCKECPEGRYGDPAIVQSNISHCPKCPPGLYGPTASAISCDSCPQGVI